MDRARRLPGGVERSQRESSIWIRWVLANLVGEAIGFGAGLSVGFALALPFGEPQGALLLIAIVVEVAVVGAIEGLSVGFAQHWVLGRALPGLRRGVWLGATIAGGIVAWGIGMGLGNWAGDQLVATFGGSWLLGGAAIGVLAGATLSAFQWLVLRHHSSRAAIWVPAHVVAWAIGMVVAFAGVDAIPDQASAPEVIWRASLIGVGMGATVAALTGIALLWLLRGNRG